MTLNEKLLFLSKYEEMKGSRMWFGKPDHWYSDPHWRCENDHVSLRYLKSEEHGDLCLACHKPVFLTFPEDVDGTPL